MKHIITILLLLGISFSQAFAQDKKPEAKTFLYFHGGKIVAAELKDKSPDIKNISEYEPPSKITNNVGWAAVVVKMDKGRSLGIYDYALKNKKGKTFPCVALREMSNPFDAGKWRIQKTDPKKYYSMLFKVEKPNLGKPEFILHYNFPGRTKDIPLQFQKADYSFTPAKSIPAEGMYGIPPKATKQPAKQPAKNPPKQAATNTKRVDFLKGKKGHNYKASSEGGPTTSLDKALDGKLNSEWHTHTKNQKHWIRLVIPEGKKQVSKVVIKWGDSYPKEYKLVTKTANNIQTKFTIIKQEKNNKGGTTTIPVNREALVVKLEQMNNPSKKTKDPLFKIKEIEVYLK